MTIATHPAVAADEIPAPPAVPAPLPRLADAASQRGNIASSDREPGQQYAGRIPHGGWSMSIATEKRVIPNSVDEALAAWDAGHEVQTVEMGGLGDGYEMAIQCVAFELMRALRDDPDLRRMNEETPDNGVFPQEFKDRLDALISEWDAKDETGRRGLGGLSGAQVGAAKNIAINFTRHGFANAREKVPDRLIFVRKQDPMALYEAEQSA